MSKLQVETISHTNNTTAQTIDSTGRILTPARPAFRAYYGATGWLDIVHGGNRRINFNTEKYDVGGCYNTSTATFTAPVSGYYHLYLYAYVHENTDTKTLILQMGTSDPASGAIIGLHQADHQQSGTMQIQGTHYFSASESCAAYLYQSTDTVNGIYSDNSTTYSGFEGYLIG